ncbi:MAG TPA: LLM class flavin-dependent oxidoreductase [Acidimicrobiia bacterium]|jgi:alkanesulfonate monooxygenase SsuD/methylene tetrahydromethanopterin reductase-like flavin-dependent oxidoreductase (luciferase family)
MRVFHPAVSPPGRLVRLGIILDQRNDARQTMRIAQMAERAGMQSLWVADRLITGDGKARMEAWTALSVAAFYTQEIRLGGMFVPGLRSPQILGAMAGSLDVVLGGRLELGVALGWDESEFDSLGLDFPDLARRVDQSRDFTRALMKVVAGEPLGAGAGIGVSSPQPGGPALTMEVRDPLQLGVAVELADNILLPAQPVAGVASQVRDAARACEDRNREPASLGIAVELPVSVGRTDGESDVRVEIDDLLSQMDTKSMGMHGTLERCQEIVIELAHLGVAEVRCILPNVGDIDDVIAQLSATNVGTKEVLRPGMARSVAPAPPTGWGAPSKPGTESDPGQ